MLNDFVVLQFITRFPGKSTVPRFLWPQYLHQTVEWSLVGNTNLKRRLNRLTPEESRQILISVNQWRKYSQLKPFKTITHSSFQLEVAHLAKLKAFQISKLMALKGSVQDKRRWILQSLKSELYTRLSKKTLLGDECLDRILGLNERKVKTQLHGKDIQTLYRNEDIYLDLDPEDLFTPYRVLAEISAHMKLQNEILVDLGSGLGRVGIVMGLLNPKIKFIGLELMKERHSQAQKAAQRLKLSRRIRFQCSDLSKSSIPLGDCYYLFNPFSYLTLKRVFQNLYINSKLHPINLVMAQVGRPPRMVKRHPWLNQVYLSPKDIHWRAHGFSVYRSR